jgi:hypothetical protein
VVYCVAVLQLLVGVLVCCGNAMSATTTSVYDRVRMTIILNCRQIRPSKITAWQSANMSTRAHCMAQVVHFDLIVRSTSLIPSYPWFPRDGSQEETRNDGRVGARHCALTCNRQAANLSKLSNFFRTERSVASAAIQKTFFCRNIERCRYQTMSTCQR